MPIWSTQGLPERAQFGFWREVICEAFAALDPEPAARCGAFPSQVALSNIGPVNAGHIASCAQIVRRGPREIRIDPQDRLFVNLHLAGAGRVTQGDQTSAIPDGSFCIVDTARPYRLEFDGDFEVLSFRVPRNFLLCLVDLPDRFFARPFSGQRGTGRIASAFMQLLIEESDALPSGHKGGLAAQLCQLVAATIAQECGISGPRRAMRGQRFLTEALGFIDAQADDAELRVTAVAQHFGVSERYVQKAFAEVGLSVSHHLKWLRLDRCARDLACSNDRRSIAAIATSRGFIDVPNFTRSFTARYGCSPRQFRNRTRAG